MLQLTAGVLVAVGSVAGSGGGGGGGRSGLVDDELAALGDDDLVLLSSLPGHLEDLSGANRSPRGGPSGASGRHHHLSRAAGRGGAPGLASRHDDLLSWLRLLLLLLLRGHHLLGHPLWRPAGRHGARLRVGHGDGDRRRDAAGASGDHAHLLRRARGHHRALNGDGGLSASGSGRCSPEHRLLMLCRGRSASRTGGPGHELRSGACCYAGGSPTQCRLQRARQGVSGAGCQALDLLGSQGRRRHCAGQLNLHTIQTAQVSRWTPGWFYHSNVTTLPVRFVLPLQSSPSACPAAPRATAASAKPEKCSLRTPERQRMLTQRRLEESSLRAAPRSAVAVAAVIRMWPQPQLVQRPFSWPPPGQTCLVGAVAGPGVKAGSAG